MIRHITQNELLLLAYNEIPPGEREELMVLVANDPKLYAEYNKLKADLYLLDTAIEKPHPTSVQIILEESCSSSSLEMI